MTSDPPLSIGQLIAQRREEQRLSQEALSQALTALSEENSDFLIDPNTIGRWERDAQSPIRYRRVVQKWLNITDSEWTRYINETRRRRRLLAATENSLRIADWNDVLSWKWNEAKLLRELIDLDHEAIPDLLENPEMEGTVEQWAPVQVRNPETWRLIIKSPKRIVGYWYFMPLHDAAYEEIKCGNILDSELTIKQQDALLSPGPFKAYFVIIAIRQKYNNITTNRMLFDSIVEQLISLARIGLFVQEFCTTAYSSDGIRLCERLEMDRVGFHPRSPNSIIFAIKMLPPPDKSPFNWYPELIKLYQDYANVHLK